jgi:tetratricopeptide (TPR) repeat protein
MSESAEAAKKRGPEHRVPLWLAMLVAVLAIWVVGLGVYIYEISRPSATESKAFANEQVAAAKRKVAGDEGSEQARLQLAYAFQRAGDYASAERQYAIVLKADKDNTAAEYNLGVISESLKDLKDAARHYLRVLAVDPGNELAAKQLALIQYAHQDWKGMISTVEPAIASNPDLSDLHYLLGVAYEKDGQRQQAIAQYREALKYYPGLREAEQALARLQ